MPPLNRKQVKPTIFRGFTEVRRWNAVPRFTPFDFGVSWVMGFFHQDWTYDGDTAADVVAKTLAQSGDEQVLAIRRDAQILGNLSSSTLEVLWEGGSQYFPAFERVGGGAEWTRTVVALCDARLSESSDVPPLAGADVEDGVGCLDAVVAEIEATQFLEAEVRAALTDCANRCTPEVAFRVLLRVMRCASDYPTLSPEQYTRLEAIGADLRYGEFVVDSVRYLIEQQ
ncbi:hypothetical protein [Streptomyces sp. NPDC086182]|uniref:hypothetical protein n=1 Tax=Streptomyces sp. NPDC086182 TaxID=3155058 RepID=UPI003436D21F